MLIYVLVFYMTGKCGPYKFIAIKKVVGKNVKEEGNDVGSQFGKSLDECKARCSGTNKCGSFAYCPGNKGCYLKDKKLTGSEPTRSHNDCTTYYRTCAAGNNIETINLQYFVNL